MSAIVVATVLAIVVVVAVACIVTILVGVRRCRHTLSNSDTEGIDKDPEDMNSEEKDLQETCPEENYQEIVVHHVHHQGEAVIESYAPCTTAQIPPSPPPCHRHQSFIEPDSNVPRLKTNGREVIVEV